MKNATIIIMLLILASSVMALEECKPVVEPEDIGILVEYYEKKQ